MKLRISYNSPVILTFALLCAVVLLIDQISGGIFIRTFFLLPPTFNAGSLLSWLTLFTYVIGHANWAHLIGNFSFILLIGPVLEEKYGSFPLLLMMLVTALATAILNLLIVRTGLYGASGIVFMMILLSSFTNIKQGEIPITFLLIVVLYLVREFVSALSPNTVSELAHIAGGLIGGLFGFLFSAREKEAALPPPQSRARTQQLDAPEKKE
jgi:membrane associated rhomboid family serine protease